MTAIKKLLEAKKNHHHVWASYMKRWSPDNLNIYYTTKKNNIRYDSVKNVAVERDFYQVQPLTHEHVQAIKLWHSKSPESVQRQHSTLLNRFLKMQHVESVYKQSGIKDDMAEKLYSAWRCNGVENLHSAHEKEVQPIIDALADCDLSVLDDRRNMILLMQFFGVQIARTKTIKDTLQAGQARTTDEKALALGKSIRECWWLLSYMIGLNIGRTMFLDRNEDVHCLLINDTDTPFITSDQPIVNVHTALTDEIKPPEDHVCDEYYPISPRVAYMVNKSNRFPSGKVQVSVDIVKEMNIKIAKRANIHIISNSEESLKPYRKYIGSNLNAVKSI